MKIAITLTKSFHSISDGTKLQILFLPVSFDRLLVKHLPLPCSHTFFVHSKYYMKGTGNKWKLYLMVFANELDVDGQTHTRHDNIVHAIRQDGATAQHLRQALGTEA